VTAAPDTGQAGCGALPLFSEVMARGMSEATLQGQRRAGGV
jgi:hypothetical protein